MSRSALEPNTLPPIFQEQTRYLSGVVGHYAFLDSCTEQGRKSAQILCNDAAGVDRASIHSQTVNSALQFFSHVL